MLYTSLDYHRNFSYITDMNNRGEILSQKKLPSNGKIIDFLKEFGEEMEVAIETTPSWYWLYDYLEGQCFEVKLSHPLKTKAIAYAKVKTDKVGSATLAHLLRSNPLPLSYVPDKSVRLNRELGVGCGTLRRLLEREIDEEASGFIQDEDEIYLGIDEHSFRHQESGWWAGPGRVEVSLC